MKILIDENIPYAHEFFDNVGEVQRFAGRELQAEQLVDVDVLLVRSITKVNEALLHKANRLTFVGTATIGEDHIDKAYLKQHGIRFSSAPGCNANSVAEFVISSLLVVSETYGIDFSDKTVSIIGLGNIGKSLFTKLHALDINILVCDPFEQDRSKVICDRPKAEIKWVSLEEALSSGDIVTFHTPLTREGSNPTFHLLNETNLELLKENVTLINASRGEVIDNNALLRHIRARTLKGRPAIHLVLDVWENEPTPLLELIPYCTLTSAHIAGYSLEGKSRGTEMLYQEVMAQIEHSANIELSGLLPKAVVSSVEISAFDETVSLSANSLLKQLVHLVFDVRRDDRIFRSELAVNGFDWIRKNYPIRREWSSLEVKGGSPELNEQLTYLGFNAR